MALLERESELDGLDRWLADVSSGSGCVVLVSGEAGIGKTSLLQHFCHRQDRSIRNLWGGCEALFTPHPLAPLYDIARQIGGDFPRFVASADRRELVFHLTIDHLANCPAPTIVVFEDIHWADEATLDFIKFLGRRLQRLGIMLIISYRNDELGAGHPLYSVIGDLPPSALHRLELAPLTPAAVAILAEAAGRSAKNLHAITGGNPFFVTEALAVPGHDFIGAEVTEPDLAEPDLLAAGRCPDAVPTTIRDAVMARMVRLSAPARALANLVALIPGKAERWLLDEITGSTADTIEECLAVGMVAQEDGSLAFRHELARRATGEYLPLRQRQALHASILQALLSPAGSEIPATRLVHHADLAGDSAAVLRFAPLAAEQAILLGAHRQAAAHYRTALRHAASLPADGRAWLFERLSYECYLTDQIVEGIAARDSALNLWCSLDNRLRVGDNQRWLSRLSWFNGQKNAAEQYATAAIDTLSVLTPGRELAMAYSNNAQLHMLADDVERAVLWGEKAIALATSLDDPEVLCHALNNVGAAKAFKLDINGRADLERSLQLALDGGFEEHAARAFTNLSSTAVRRRDFAAATRYLAAGIAYCEEHDLNAWMRYMMAHRAVTSLALGDWQDAAEEAQAIIRQPRVAPISKIPALVVLGLVRARRGDPDVETPLDEAKALACPTSEIQRIGPVVAARAEAAWLAGNLPAMADDIGAGYNLAHQQSDPWIASELAFWLQRCKAAMEDAPCGCANGAADEVAESERDIDLPFALQRAGNWRAAAASWERHDCPYERALALADGDDEASLRLALEICERLGAGPLAAIIRRKLRASGIRGISRGAQERHRQNPHGLTGRELKVLGILVQGSRNADIARRLFVSEKTVDHHVSAILAKLGVRSRGEAAAAALRLGLGATLGAEFVSGGTVDGEAAKK
jgi:DNA-binding CsgD family transcriptional regulator